ncbi:MAG: antibiotic biosynthesis monooxygenase [Dehalococcoidia bacterium]
MYGTVAHMKVKAGKGEELIALMRGDIAERTPKGMRGVQVYRLDSNPDEFMLVVQFDDKASYVANAEDPAQDAEFRKLRDLLEADPHWHDGEVIHVQSA